MPKFMKILLGAALICGLLALAGALLLPRLLQPNNYKSAIAAAISQRTGRDVSIDGDIELTIFPWTGVIMGPVTLANKNGFSSPYLARIDRLEGSLRFMPFLSGKIDMDAIVLRGLDLRLERNARGQTNFAGLMGGKTTQDREVRERDMSGRTDFDLSGLTIGGVDIAESRLVWEDAISGRKISLAGIRLNTGVVAADRPFQIELSGEAASSAPDLRGPFTLAGLALFDAAGKNLQVNGLRLDADFAGTALPGGKAKGSLTADALWDGGAKRLEVKKLTLEADMGDLGFRPRLAAALVWDLGRDVLELRELLASALGIEAKGRFDVAGLGAEPAVKGVLAVASFNPREVMPALRLGPVSTTDPAALTTLSLAAEVDATSKRVEFSHLTVKLDDATISGRASISDYDAPAYSFDLLVDALNVDRYLPPATERVRNGQEESSEALGEPYDVSWLRALRLDGQARLGELTAHGLRLQNVVAKAAARDGVLRLDPVSASLHGGSLSGKTSIETAGDDLAISQSVRIAGMQMEPFLQALAGRQAVTVDGPATISADLTTRMEKGAPTMRSLSGKIGLAMRDGVIKGFSASRQEITQRAGTPRFFGEGRRTPFSELRANFDIERGVAQNKDFRFISSSVSANGGGSVDLVSRDVNSLVFVELKPLPRLPLRIAGNLSGLSVGVDESAALRGAARGLGEAVQAPIEIGKGAADIGRSAAEGAAEGLAGGLRDLLTAPGQKDRKR